MNRTVLVAGATGRQGGAAVRHLLEAGWHPRALTRNPEAPAARLLRDRGIEVVRGNMHDEASLREAMDGAYGVFSVQDSRSTGLLEEARQGMNMANAALQAGVQHFVYSSIASADRQSHIEHFETKYMVEGHLRWIGLNRTILRPVLFMENLLRPRIMKALARGRFVGHLPRDRTVQLVSVEDVGAFATAAFLDPESFSRKVVEIAGDELTTGEIVEELGRWSGRKVRFLRLPGFLFWPLGDRETHRLLSWLDRGGFSVDIEVLSREYPEVRPTKFRDWLETQRPRWGEADLA